MGMNKDLITIYWGVSSVNDQYMEPVLKFIMGRIKDDGHVKSPFYMDLGI